MRRLATAALTAALVAMPALPALAADAPPSQVQALSAWRAVDGTGLKWTAPATGTGQASVTGYRITRLPSGSAPGTTPQPVEVATLPAGATTYADTASYQYSGRYTVVPLSDAGDGQARSSSVVASGETLPSGTDEVSYLRASFTARALRPAGTDHVVSGTRDEVHVDADGGTLGDVVVQGLDTVSQSFPTFGPVTISPNAAGGLRMRVEMPNGADPCLLGGTVKGSSPSWYADGRVAALSLSFVGGCYPLGDVSVYVTWNKAAPDQVPALVTYERPAVATVTPGAPVAVDLPLHNAGGQATAYTDRELVLKERQEPYPWTLDRGDCAVLPVDGRCTLHLATTAPRVERQTTAYTGYVDFPGDHEAVEAEVRAQGVAAPGSPTVDVPGHALSGTAVSVPFTLSGPQGSTAECRVDDGQWVPCSSPFRATVTTQGPHSIWVQGRADGEYGQAVVASVTVDSGAPAASVVVPRSPVLGSRTVVIGAALGAAPDVGPAEVSGYDFRERHASVSGSFGAYVQPAAWRNAGSSVSLAAAPGYQYCLSTRTRDLAGNIGAWSAERCITVPVDDRALTASAGFVRGTSSAHYAGTYSRAARAGATLTRAGVSGRQVGVVATTCPTCGAVDVYLGGVRLGRVSLVSSRTAYKQVRWVPLGATRTGTLVLRTVDAKPVVVDGVVVQH